jgi:hypothetical protein
MIKDIGIFIGNYTSTNIDHHSILLVTSHFSFDNFV